MVDKKYNVEILFPENPNLDMNGLERELEISPSHQERITMSTSGPIDKCLFFYMGLEKPKALQIINRFSELDDVLEISLRVALPPYVDHHSPIPREINRNLNK